MTHSPRDQLTALRATIDTLHAMNRAAMRTASPRARTVLTALNRQAARYALAVRAELVAPGRERQYLTWELAVAEIGRHSEFYRSTGRMAA